MIAAAVVMICAAVAVAFWPKSRPLSFVVQPSLPAKPPAGPTYAAAIDDLANVRKRLIQTEALADAQKAAIDTLTLALVAGSDK